MSRWGAQSQQHDVRLANQAATVPRVVLAQAWSEEWIAALERAFPVSPAPTAPRLNWLSGWEQSQWSGVEFQQALVIVEISATGSDREWEQCLRAIVDHNNQQTWIAVTAQVSVPFRHQLIQAGVAEVLEDSWRVTRLRQIAERHFRHAREPRLSLEQKIWLNLPWG